MEERLNNEICNVYRWAFVIIPNSMAHSEINIPSKEIMSAGFCDLSGNKCDGYKVTSYGESHTLKIKSNEDDGYRMGIALSAVW